MVSDRFESMEFEEMLDFVTEILTNDTIDQLSPIKELLSDFDVTGDKEPLNFSTRSITGKQAEEAFLELHRDQQFPIHGELVDRTLHGCGYDFEIQQDSHVSAIEVKGLSGLTGGISLTSKEWQIAKNMGPDYYLVIVRSVGNGPDFQIIKDPFSKLDPKRTISTVIQVRWNVGGKGLTDIE